MDCANCANKMEDAANKTPGVKSAVVNFMTLKMHVEFEGAGPQIGDDCGRDNCKKVEDDCEGLPVSLPSRLSSPSRWSTRREGDAEEGKGCVSMNKNKG